MAIDALSLQPGARVLHIGAGLGYYSGLMAHASGPTGRVVAIEVDETLATRARQNLAAFPWVEVRHGNGVDISESFDGILVNAGVTHPQESWLNALTPKGRLVVPLTATFPKMGTIGKGLMILVSKREADAGFDARVLTMVAIYSALGLRDEPLNDALCKVLMRGAMAPLTRMRRDPHEPGPSCWFHAGACCFSTGA
jgi:protein-L-isoaspartate(D-aspartate) O-methyltransferase